MTKNRISWKRIKKTFNTPMKRKKSRSKIEQNAVLQNQSELSTMDNDWESILEDIVSGERSISNNDFSEKYQSLDEQMGFGYVSRDRIEAKVVLQGPNPFMDNQSGDLNSSLFNYEPYSQIFNINGIKETPTFLILRCYLYLH